MKNMSFFDIMRWFLMGASLISFITSILFLSLFSLPHSPEMPVVDTWQEIGPDIISNLYDINNNTLEDEDLSTELLLAVSSMVGSLGYDKATFYLTMSPYWNTILTTISLFSMLMMLTSVVVLYYLLLSLRLKDRFCLVPWILQHILVEIVLLVMLVILFMDLSNMARMQLEVQTGDGNFAMVVTGLITASVYVFLVIMVASLHVVEQVQLMDKQLDVAKNILRMVQRV